jgi:hypothetical protein
VLSFVLISFGVRYSKTLHIVKLHTEYTSTAIVSAVERAKAQRISIYYNTVYVLLVNKMGIMSTEERLKKQQDFIDIEESNKCNMDKWSDIKKKTTKDLLIELFAVEMKRAHRLTIKQTQYLISFICMAILFKSLTSAHINIEDGRIKSIIGIDFRDRNVDYDLELYSSELDESSTSLEWNDRIKMIENWDKYIVSLKKKSDL